MCGIVGEISFNAIMSQDWVLESSHSIKHRGPDDHGIWSSKDKKVVFGHRRLSIIDLSRDGKQPMISNCENYVITFNGEIYNYKALYQNLKNLGITLKTKTDTEVLINSYIVWGDDFLNKIEGMFAFAIYDKKKNIVLLARDKSAEKPLYLYNNNFSLSFCSELKGLLKNPSIDRKLSEESFIEYLQQGYVSGKKCLIKNVTKLKSGEYLKYNLSNGKLLFKKYFNLPLKNKSENFFKNTNILIDKFENLLKDSINNQINADVPVGILLSGGLDSSLITAIASKNNKNINTYTFVNDKSNSNDFELNNSRNISKHFATNHTEIYYPAIDVNIVEEISDFLDDPIMDSSIIPTYLISKEIKKYCTVALGGDGGDELFGGYDHYSRLIKLVNMSKFIPNSINCILSQISKKYLPIGFRGRNWLNLMGKNISKDFLDFAVYFDTYNNFKIINKKYINLFKDLKFLKRESLESDDCIYKACYQDFNNFLIEDILVKTDRSSMANSLELRSPFLDTNIINFAFRDLQSSLKATSNNKKIFLKKFASRILPKNFQFNKKRGFSIPINDYFKKKNWQEMAINILLDNDSLFNTKFVSDILKKPFFNHNNSERIFGLITFELWRKKYKVSIV